MPYQSRRRRPLATTFALLTLLGVTTGWTQPTTAGHHIVSISAPVGGAGLFEVQDRSMLAARAAAFAVFTTQSEAAVVAGIVANEHVRELARQANAAAAAKAKAPAPTVRLMSGGTYSGRNHFWIPSLHMSYQVYSYPCSRTTRPANLIYRWGCAGRNNVYLLGHAGGVMKPLHDLYVRGGLKVGMLAIYADSTGRIRSYRVTAWQVVYPTVVSWAIASQPVPSMTLQTCVGPNSSKRLDVRLVAVN